MAELQTKKPDAGKLVYVKTAAQMLCCTEQHIYSMIRDGKLTAIRLGPRALRIVKESIDTYVAENEVNPEDYYI